MSCAYPEFLNEYRRLLAAFSQAEPSESRIKARWNYVAKLDIEDVRTMVDQLLVESTFPSRALWERAAAEARSKAVTRPGGGGRFRSDGSWDGRADDDNALTKFVRQLIGARLASELTPADLAEMIRASEHADAFSPFVLEAWSTVHDFRLWPNVPAFRSIEEAVKRCGKGSRWPHADPRMRSGADVRFNPAQLVASAIVALNLWG